MLESKQRHSDVTCSPTYQEDGIEQRGGDTEPDGDRVHVVTAEQVLLRVRLFLAVTGEEEADTERHGERYREHHVVGPVKLQVLVCHDDDDDDAAAAAARVTRTSGGAGYAGCGRQTAVDVTR